MRYEVTHRTRYEYDKPVESSYGQMHQLPLNGEGQRCLTRSHDVKPTPSQIRQRSDFFGNEVLFYSIHDPHLELDVVSRSVVDTSERVTDYGSIPAASRPWTHTISTVEVLANPSDSMALQFVLSSPRVTTSDDLAEFARSFFEQKYPLTEAVVRLASHIFDEFEFSPEATDVATPVHEVVKKKAGVCQDFTHLMIGSLRSLGVPARYVSGYLETKPPDGRPKLAGADQSHAWVDVYMGGGLWMGIDPTNDRVIDEFYVTTAKGRDYDDITPLKGVVFTEATETKMHVSVDVSPLSCR